VSEKTKPELDKTLKAMLLVSLGSLKQKQKIAILDRAGFGQSEIADVVSSTPKAVSVRLAEIRKEARKGQSRKSK
jgi:hypothetical protein